MNMNNKDDFPSSHCRSTSPLLGFVYFTSWRRLILLIGLVSLLFYVISVTIVWYFNENSRILSLTSLYPVHSSTNELDGEHNKIGLINAWLRSTQAAGLFTTSSAGAHRSSPLTFPDSDGALALPVNETEEYRQKALKFFFGPKMSQEDRRNLLDTLSICLKVIESVGLPYFLYGGTLIGYYRHNGSLIPWDDDCDVALLTKSEADVRAFMPKLEAEIKKYSGYSLTYVHHHRRYKCFGNLPSNSHVIDTWRQWRWPFIDLQFMREIRNGTRPDANKIVQDYSSPSFLYPNDVVYPLRRVTFSEQQIPAFIPNNVKAAVSKNYKITECKSASGYDHRRERPTSLIISVDCAALKKLFNFTNIP